MYNVDFTPQAEADLSSLDHAVLNRIVAKIEWLSDNIESTKCEELTGQFKGKFKLRVGDWRVIYSVSRSTHDITIYAVEHRSRIYKT